MKTLRYVTRAALGAVLLSLTATTQAATFGLTPYVQASDSPFAALSFSNFYFQNFESIAHGTTANAINFNSGGTTVSVTSGTAIFVYGQPSLADSVDADDGTIDGSGSAGRSLFRSSGSSGITFNFSGTLPTHAGAVWTDGGANSRFYFEAFDHLSVSMGIIGPGTANNSNVGQTAEDRFGGYSNALGITSLKIWNTGGGIEIDHFQYGTISNTSNPIPDSGSTLLTALFATLSLLALRRRLT